MNEATTNRDHVLAVMAAALQQLRNDATAVTASTAVGTATPKASEATAMVQALESALQWAMTREKQLYLAGEIEDLEHGDMYLSRDPVISLTQSAIEEYGDASVRTEAEKLALSAASVADIVELIKAKLKYLTERPRPFVQHQTTADFRFELASTCKVAVVADWGTGSPGAIAVARQIRATQPDHVIHLGDVYPSGTPEEAEKHFIRVWKAHGPQRARYWALNGNHEMISKGYGYFDYVLPFCKQHASYFALGNEHWSLIGLDTAYRDHDLEHLQHDWLSAQLKHGTAKKVLLTHHQAFSAVDRRPGEHKLAARVTPFLENGAVFGWFWGYEHGCLKYDASPKFWNLSARCIGHGGKDIKLPYYKAPPKYPAPNVAASYEVGRPNEPSRARNGFALLTFQGPQLEIRYIDQEGELWGVPEVW